MNDIPIPVVEVHNLRKVYGGRAVVDGVDLTVGPGQIVGLIGANGAGKTTTVECIQGLRRPDGGTISVLGLDPVGHGHAQGHGQGHRPGHSEGECLRSLIGSQLQNAALPDRLRVGEAVRLFAGRDEPELLARFGLGPRHRSAFAVLSGGERQRLFLVLALLHRPRLVILDELTQGLDPAARRTVWAAVDDLRKDGTSVLLVTHELDEAEQLCDHVVAMRGGRVLAEGTPAELVDRYGTSTTITFSVPAPGCGELLERLRRLPGVVEVTRAGPRVTVAARSRAAIAHVGAELLAHGPVPTDLTVRTPTLDDALVELLARSEPPADHGRAPFPIPASQQPANQQPDLIGALP